MYQFLLGFFYGIIHNDGSRESQLKDFPAYLVAWNRMRLTIREGFVGTRAISVGRVALRKSEADGLSQGVMVERHYREPKKFNRE